MPQPTAASHQCIARQGSTHVDTWYATSSKTMCDNCYSFCCRQQQRVISVLPSWAACYTYISGQPWELPICGPIIQFGREEDGCCKTMKWGRLRPDSQRSLFHAGGRRKKVIYNGPITTFYVHVVKAMCLTGITRFRRSMSSRGRSRPWETGSILSATSAHRLLGQRCTCRSWKCKRLMWLVQNF
jgi:hypothetical protein